MIYQVRGFAYLEGPKGDLWAGPGQYIQARNADAVQRFLVKSGQTHKVLMQQSAPEGADFVGVPAELCDMRVIGETRSMAKAAEPQMVKRGPGRPRKVQPIMGDELG